MSLNLHHLRIFARVAELGGFSRAAEALHLSQPAVSKSVRELERQLQTTLFDRSAGAHRLTDAGAALLPRARELFAVERMAEEELRRIRGLEAGVLRIGASTTIAFAFQITAPGGALPAALTLLDVRLPPGMGVDTSGLATCTPSSLAHGPQGCLSLIHI